MKSAFLVLLALPSILTGLLFAHTAAYSTPRADRAIAQFTEKQTTFQNFSIRYPAHWIIERSDRLEFYNQRLPKLGSLTAPPYLIKTEAALSSFGLNNLPKPEPIDGKLLKVEKLQINGRAAIRRWYGRSESFDKTIQTFIQYSDQETIVIFSYYGTQNRTAEAAIYRLHNSIKVRASNTSS